MKVIIAGSREGFTQKDIYSAYELSGFIATEIVSGTARGVDKMGEQYAKQAGISIKQFPADWDGLGKRAGYVRNAQMAEYSDCLIALWDGESKGTKHMIDLAKKQGLAVFVYKGHHN